MTKVQKKLPSHNIGFAKAGAKFPGVEDFRTLSRKKTFSFFIFCKFEKRKWFLLEFVFIESFKFLSPAFAKPLTVKVHLIKKKVQALLEPSFYVKFVS